MRRACTPSAGRRTVLRAVHWLGGGKSEAEPAFVIEPMRAAIFGDLVRSHESGRLRLLPDPKLSDRERAIADVRALGVDFDVVLFSPFATGSPMILH